MGNRYKFTCNKCGNRWRSIDYDENDENQFKYHFGYKCPKCEEDDISTEDDD